LSAAVIRVIVERGHKLLIYAYVYASVTAVLIPYLHVVLQLVIDTKEDLGEIFLL
jgi:hypothetical protein